MGNTINDKDWQKLQERARKANPKLADTFSKEATERRKAANKQAEAGRKGRN